MDEQQIPDLPRKLIEAFEAYTAVEGDTLTSIAKKHRLTPEALLEYDGGTSQKNRERLSLPPADGKRSSASQATADLTPQSVPPGTQLLVPRQKMPRLLLRAQAVGYDPGTAATLDIFRFRKETAKDLLTSIPASIGDGGELEAEWDGTFEPEGSSPDCFVAKIRVGGIMLSSAHVLEIAKVQQITSARWDRRRARWGDTVKLTVTVQGIPDGSILNLAIFEKDIDTPDDLVWQGKGTVENGRVEAEHKIEWVDTEPEGDEYEFYFQVVHDETGRTANSSLLYVDLEPFVFSF